MAKNRMVNTDFWEDTWVATLTPIERLLFLYLITNPRTNILGVYEIRLARIALDVGVEESSVERILSKFQASGRVTYMKGWMIVHNFERHQTLSGSSIEEAKKALAKSIPDDVYRARIHPVQTLPNLPSSLVKSKSLSNQKGKALEYGDPEVNTVVAHFEKSMDTKMPRVAAQRRAASTLIKRHGVKNVIGAINFAGTLLGKDKKPQVYTLEDLRDKWKMLEVHAGKAVKQDGEDEKLKQVFQ